MRRAVSFRRACIMSLPIAESCWLTLDPGSFTFIFLLFALGSLAAAVDQAAPPHDLRRRVQHSVNLLALAEGIYIS